METFYRICSSAMLIGAGAVAVGVGLLGGLALLVVAMVLVALEERAAGG